MSRRKKPLSVDQWIEVGKLVKESRESFSKAAEILLEHFPKTIIRQVLNPWHESLCKTRSRLEDEMFRQHPDLPSEATHIFYGEKPYENHS